MSYIEDFINRNTEDGKVQLSKIYECLFSRFRMPVRTFQWHVKQGLLPKPEKEWKTGYYTKEMALEVLQKAQIIVKLKDYIGIDLSMIRKIFRNYEGQSQALIEELLNDINHYPAFYQEDQWADALYDKAHSMVMKRICEELAEGIELDKLNAVDINEEIRKKYSFG